jgi:CubicO group peptidase (beta-lactamase class C family)
MAVADRMSFHRVPGVTVAVVRNGRLHWTQGRGVRAAGQPDPVTADTLFQAASISKPVVALATLRLVERGDLPLDGPVNEHLTSWAIPANEFTNEQDVTLRQLLAHSGGTTNSAVGIYGPDEPRPPVRVDFVPGSRWRYSGGGYSILQQLLADVTGQSFPEFMEALVLAPAGMQASGYYQPLPDHLAATSAAGHDGQGATIRGRWWTLPEMAAGGLWTTAPDLGRFIIALCAAYQGEPGALLGRETAREMMRHQIGGWGLGLAVDDVDGERRVSHTGSNDGYRAVFVALPARGDGIAILTNGDRGDSLRTEILQAAARVYEWPGYETERRSPVTIDPPVLRELAGRYDYGGGFATIVRLDGHRLVAQLNDGPAYELYATSGSDYFTLSGTGYRFERDDTGAVVAVLANLGTGRPLRGVRIREQD